MVNVKEQSNNVIYKETVPLGNTYKKIIFVVVVFLAFLTLIFVVVDLSVGVLSTILTAVFVWTIYLTFKDVKLIVTSHEFIIKWWFIKSRITLADIETVEIKDVDDLPIQYKGHVKIYWGVRSFKDLKVVKLRKGKAVHIKISSGKTIIITAKSNEALVKALQD